MRVVGVYVTIEARIDRPPDDVEGGAGARWKAIPDRIIKVVSEDQRVAGDGLVRYQSESDTVLIMGMRCGGEIRGRLWGAKREALYTRSASMKGYEESRQKHTAVILYPDVNVCRANLRGYVGGVGPIDRYDLMSRAVIAGTNLNEIRCQLAG